MPKQKVKAPLAFDTGVRWILLNLLWHSLPAEASDSWQLRQMEKAGATKEEIDQIRAE